MNSIFSVRPIGFAALFACIFAIGCGPKRPYFNGPGNDAHWPIDAPEASQYSKFLEARRLSNAGVVEGSIAEYQEAIRLDGASTVLYTGLSKEYIRVSDLPRAEEAARKAIGIDPKNVEARYILGKILAARQDWPGSEQELKQVISLDVEGDGDGVIALASVYVESKRPELAVEILTQLLAKNPSNIFGLYYLGRVYSEMNRLDDALASYEKAVEQNPGFTSATKATALIYEYQGKKEKAIEAYRRALVSEPDDVSVRGHLARIYLEQEMMTEAKAELEVLARQQPENLTSRLRLGLVHMQEANYVESEKVFRALLKDAPAVDRVHYYLGVVLEKQGNSDVAAKEFEKVAPDSEIYIDSRIAMAFLREVKGDLIGSEKILRSALSKNPNSIPAYSALANVLVRKDQSEDAVALLREATIKFPKDETVWYALGEVYDKLKNPAKVDECMHMVLSINPDNANALNFLGYTYAERGVNLAEAERLIKRALEFRPKDGFITDSLGWVYYKMAKFEDSVRVLSQAVELTPNEPVIMEHLADALHKTGQTGLAKELYEKVIQLTKEDSDLKRVKDKLLTLGTP